ncbi:MAG: response regulator transcription factor [Bacteroidales bacterium]
MKANIYRGKHIKILVVDSDEADNTAISHLFIDEGFTVYSATDGPLALDIALRVKPDVVLLDIALPGMDGIEVCEEIRKKKHLGFAKIVFLTARAEDYNQIAGFEAGADDYIVKPVKPKVLLHRVNALLRRKTRLDSGELESNATNSLTIDFEKFAVFINGREVTLTKKEFELLHLLKNDRHKVFSRDEIYTKLWPERLKESNKRTIDVHVRKLRKKLGGAYIKTYRGLGYWYNDSGET